MATRAWNEADPADTDNASNGAQEIRELKIDIRERMALEHAFGVAIGDTNAGMHHWAYAYKAASVSLGLTEHLIYALATANPTLTLPDATLCKGKSYVVWVNGVGTVTLSAITGQYITGIEASLVASAQTYPLYGTARGRDGVMLVSDGVQWLVMLHTKTNATFNDISKIKGLGYVWPAARGAAGSILRDTDGAGTLAWDPLTLPTAALTAEGQVGYDNTNNRMRYYSPDGEEVVPTITEITAATVLNLADTSDVAWTDVDVTARRTGSTPARWALCYLHISWAFPTSALTLSLRRNGASSSAFSCSNSLVDCIVMIPLDASEIFEYSISETHGEDGPENVVTLTMFGFLT